MPPAEPCGLFSLEADDSLIQELLAGIPSTAWLPTDPLTSEGWFPDPASSIITQDYSARPAGAPGLDATGEETLLRAAATARADHANALAASTGALPPRLTEAPAPGAEDKSRGGRNSSSTTKTPRLGGDASLDAASNQALQATPDARLLAGVRSKRGTPLMSRGGSKRGNPLSGFAKKHSIAYPVGNQMAILSPELLSSSPPNAAQLRKNPYKYYSPPKHLAPRPVPAQAKGRNLMLGARGPRAIQPQPQPQPPQLVGAVGRAQAAGAAQRQRTISGSSSTHSLISNGLAGGVPRMAAKWDIGQDKLLLRGVRYHRWRDGLPPRDPTRFVADDWEQIALSVSAGGMARSARQCRRRWAVMYSHLGSTIMEFVDSTPTPQSSAQSTPVPHGSAASGSSLTGPAPRHARNLQLAGLPRSSPPLAPGAVLRSDIDRHPPRPVPMAAPQASDERSSALSMLPNLGLDLAGLLAPAEVDLQSLDVANRWATPGYCQLLTDIVHAITNPESRAAEVVRKGAATAPSAPADGSAVAEQPANAPGPAVSKKAQHKTSRPSTGTASGLVAGLSGALSLDPGTRAPQTLPHSAMPQAAGVVAGQLSALQSLGPQAAAEVLSGPFPAASTPGSALTAQSAGAGVEGVLDLATSDQDMNVYLDFIRSLTADQGDLGGAWSSLFDDPGNSTLPLVSAAGSLAPGAVLAGDRRTTLPAAMTWGAPAGRPLGVEDDDANDGDFVLEDSEDVDDDDDEDDGDDDSGEQPAGPASDDSPHVGAMDVFTRRPALGPPSTDGAASDSDRGH
ncbi:hypothetical protein IWQ57_003981, partial [Coemansia nantahalensis]